MSRLEEDDSYNTMSMAASPFEYREWSNNAGPLYTTIQQIPDVDLVSQLVNILAQAPSSINQLAAPLMREIERRLMVASSSTATTTTTSHAAISVMDDTVYIIPDNSRQDLSYALSYLQAEFPRTRFVARPDFFDTPALANATSATMPKLKLIYLITPSTNRLTDANLERMAHIKRNWGSHTIMTVLYWASNNQAAPWFVGSDGIGAQLIYHESGLVKGANTTLGLISNFLNTK